MSNPVITTRSAHEEVWCVADRGRKYVAANNDPTVVHEHLACFEFSACPRFVGYLNYS